MSLRVFRSSLGHWLVAPVLVGVVAVRGGITLGACAAMACLTCAWLGYRVGQLRGEAR